MDKYKALAARMRADKASADRMKEAVNAPDANVGDIIGAIEAEQPLSTMAVLQLLYSEDEISRMRKRQTERAQRPRGDAEISRIIARLATQEGTAKTKWDALYGRLAELGANPVEVAGNSLEKTLMEYLGSDEKPRSITFGTFQNRLSKEKKSR